MDQIDKISSSIFSMEQEILSERKKELKSLIKKKEEILQKMTILETSLDEVNREISTRVSRYRNTVTNRISQLEQEMNGKKSESPPLQSTQVNETQENP
jgi:chromosome segregation ATPase